MNKKFYMAGTEGTGLYQVIAANDNGRVGYRDLGDTYYRIRIEPASEAAEKIAINLPRESGWKQPGDNSQDRFSKVVNADDLEEELVRALNAVGVYDDKDAVTWNPDFEKFTPNHPIDLMVEDVLQARAQAEDLRRQAATLMAQAGGLEAKAAEVEAAAQAFKKAQQAIEALGYDITGETVTAEARRQELEAKTPNELQKILKSATGKGMFGATKKALVAAIISAE